MNTASVLPSPQQLLLAERPTHRSSPRRVEQIRAAFRYGVTARQPRAAEELKQVRRGNAGTLQSAPSLVETSNSPPLPKPFAYPGWVPRPVQPLLTGLAKFGDAGVRGMSRLETPSFVPDLDRALRLPWCYPVRATLACSVAACCGAAIAVGSYFNVSFALLAMMSGMNHAFLQLLVSPWALCCNSGVDDGLATLAGAARLGENAEAVKNFQAMQMTLRLQYDLIVHNLVTVAMHGGGALTTLALGSSLLACLPGLSTIGVTLALHGMVTFFRMYYMPVIDNWQQRQENANRMHGAEALPVLSSGLPSDYLIMRQRHDAHLAEQSRRVAYSRLLRNAFEFIEAALLVWVFGLRNNKVNQLGYAALSTVSACRNINVSHKRIRGAHGKFIEQFIEPPLAPCVNPSRLQVFADHNDERPFGEMLDAIAEARPGLWQIRGHNGSGKSTLQRLAKELCGLDAIYQPAKPAFSRGGLLLSRQSTGEAMYNRIQEILKDRQPHQNRLLFDEPLAPLSAEWRRAIMHTFKELAKTCCVVMINHEPQED